MTEDLKLIIVAAAPTVAVIVSRIWDELGHRRLDRKMDLITKNGSELKRLTGGKV